MLEVEILLDRVKTIKDDQGNHLQKNVFFAVKFGEEMFDKGKFEVRVKMSPDVADEDLIREARLKLHQIALGMERNLQGLIPHT